MDNCDSSRDTVAMNYLGPGLSAGSAADAQIVILPVPYERSTSYGQGTKNGPAAVLAASPHLEFYDHELDSEPWRCGIYTAAAIECSRQRAIVFQDMTTTVRELTSQGKLVISIGGEHSISFPLYQGVHGLFDDLSVVQLDAHSDLRDSFEGSRFSHACVMRRIWEINKHITGIGIRAQDSEERNFVKKNNIDLFYAHELRKNNFSDSLLDKVLKNVYLTIDVDFFDPSVIPATGTPEPGGFGWYETLDFIQKVFIYRNVVGIDIVELSPNKNHEHADFTVAKLIYKMIGFISSGRKESHEES